MNNMVDDEAHRRMYPGGAILVIETLLKVWTWYSATV